MLPESFFSKEFSAGLFLCSFYVTLPPRPIDRRPLLPPSGKRERDFLIDLEFSSFLNLAFPSLLRLREPFHLLAKTPSFPL